MAPKLDLSVAWEHPYLLLSTLFFFYLCSLVAYRLYWHPLAHIPGPKLAAATHWYEFYYDVILGGQYLNQFRRMHEKYGPIIRISPNDLHCIDPAFADTIYAGGGSGKKRDKDVFNLQAFQLWHSCFGTVDHDLHRLRRSSVNPFFSKASVLRLESVIRSYIDKMCDQIGTYANTDEACNLSWAFICLSTDIITEYSFGWDRGYTSNRTFQPNLSGAMVGGQKPAHLFRHLPFLLPILDQWLPESVASKLIPGGVEYFNFQNQIFATADDVYEGKKELGEKEGQRTIFKDVLEGDLPEQEKSRQRLRESAREIIGAGAATTASALSVCSYYLLANPETMAKLYAELCAAIPNPASIPPLTTLEKLPYLSAVLHEALRFSCGVASRIPRVPHEQLTYTGTHKGNPVQLIIPPRTSIGMSAYLVHTNPDVFSEPEKWMPERWLDENGKRHKELDPYLLSFSKGSRQCLGINLAWAELHITVATMVRRFGTKLELYNTGPAEVEYSYDMFEPGKASTKGVEVKLH